MDNNIPEARKTMDNLLGMLKMFETPVDGIVSSKSLTHKSPRLSTKHPQRSL